MKTKILKVLKSTSGYVSGQELCESLGVSRTAVWKVIRQLARCAAAIGSINIFDDRCFRHVNADTALPHFITKGQFSVAHQRILPSMVSVSSSPFFNWNRRI